MADAPFAGHAHPSRDYTRVLIALGCAGVATFGQLYSPQGALPTMARQLGVSAPRAALIVSSATIGVAVGVLPWSWAADRIGRVRAMKWSLIVSTVLGLLIPLWPEFTGIVVLRFIEGLALGGLPALAVTYLHEEMHASVTAVAAGTYVAGTSAGGLIGRLVAGPVAGLAGWRVGLGAVSLLSAAATVAFFIAVPTPRGFDPRSAGERLSLGQAVLANLRRPALLVLFGQGFLVFGSFVAVYNYLGFRLEAAPYRLAPGVVALIFLAYLAGTVSARWAGSAAAAHGRRAVLIVSTAAMVLGAVLTLGAWLPLILFGLVVLTAGFFAAHAIISGWVGHEAHEGRAQAASLYTLSYYAGASVIGWFGGVMYTWARWPGTAGLVIGLALAALAGAVWLQRGAHGAGAVVDRGRA